MLKINFRSSVFLFLLSVLFLFSCTVTKHTASNKEMDNLLDMMTGTFNSENQAMNDSSYYDITLQMYPIWENKDGNWLYVEQALSSVPNKPYRQRIYKIFQQGNQFVSAVYTLPKPEEYIGAWETPEKFNDLSSEDLELREGCAVYLSKTSDGHFIGATGENSCGSTMRGASFATSKVRIEKNKIVSWDQGFDKDGKQVWGATQGGYIFERVK